MGQCVSPVCLADVVFSKCEELEVQCTIFEELEYPYSAYLGIYRGTPLLALGDPRGDHDNAEYYASWCGNGLEYLDDSKCAKVFPSAPTRNIKCATSSDSEPPLGFAPDLPFSQIRPESLEGVVTNGADACVILTRRGLGGQQLFNKYFCTPQGQAYETWSSSKIFAMANAGGTLRGREPADSCAAGVMGLDSATTGKASPTLPLGDLATIVCLSLIHI